MFLFFLGSAFAIAKQSVMTGTLVSLSAMFLGLLALLTLIWVWVWSKPVEIARVRDTRGKVVFEIVKEPLYMDEFDAFVGHLQNAIAHIGMAIPDTIANGGAIAEKQASLETLSSKSESPNTPDTDTLPPALAQAERRLSLSIIDITKAETSTDLPVDGPYEATANLITDTMLALPHTRNVLRLEQDDSEWLEVGWAHGGFVFRETIGDTCFYSNSPIKDAEEAAEFVAEYLTRSVCEPKHWFRVNGGQATYDYILGRFWFEVAHKRYPVTSTWAQSLYIGAHVVLAIWLFFYTLPPVSGNPNNPIPTIIGVIELFVGMSLFAGVLMLKFDFRDARKKGKHAYNGD